MSSILSWASESSIVFRSIVADKRAPAPGTRIFKTGTGSKNIVRIIGVCEGFGLIADLFDAPLAQIHRGEDVTCGRVFSETTCMVYT